MHNIIEKALEKSYSYKEYRALISKLLSEGKTTGENQGDELFKYTHLNDKRMARLDKTLVLQPETIEELERFKTAQTWLLISEGWCGDASQILPYIAKMVENKENINLRLVLRDENLELMDNFLTNGGRSIPKLIMIDGGSKNVIASWGPRPDALQKIYNELRDSQQPFSIIAEELQKWYNFDKGAETQKEIIATLKQIK